MTNWAEQVQKSLGSHDEFGWLPYPTSMTDTFAFLLDDLRASAVERAFMPLAAALILERQLRLVVEEFAVDSPIEKAFLWALVVVCVEREVEVRGSRGPVIGEGPEELTITPQAKVRRYRVDFRLQFKSWMPFGGGEGPWTAEMFVECDGHDYHERTKEQAARDRKRDRELQTFGLPVFRFTGSEIFRDPIQCAKIALKELDARAFGKKEQE